MKVSSMSHTPIERENRIQEMIVEAEERLKSQELQMAEADEGRKAIIERIRRSCSTFSVIAPQAWKTFSEDISTMHTLAMMLDRRTPLDAMSEEKKFGVRTDAMQWALQKAFVQGQLEILDSIMGVMKIEEKIPERKRLTFFQKLLNLFAD